eukprot:408760_1
MAESAKKQKSTSKRSSKTPKNTKYTDNKYPIPGLKHIKIFLGKIKADQSQKSNYKIEPGLGTYQSVNALFNGYTDDNRKDKLNGSIGLKSNFNCFTKTYKMTNGDLELSDKTSQYSFPPTAVPEVSQARYKEMVKDLYNGYNTKYQPKRTEQDYNETKAEEEQIQYSIEPCDITPKKSYQRLTRSATNNKCEALHVKRNGKKFDKIFVEDMNQNEHEYKTVPLLLYGHQIQIIIQIKIIIVFLH